MISNNPQKTDDTRQSVLQALKDFKTDEAARREDREIREAEKEKKQKMRLAGQWIILIVCAAIVIFQLPKIIGVFKKTDRPIRYGTYATDERTDECIENLWKILALIQKGELPGDSILCPASQKPYVVKKTLDDLIVFSPEPELYGFKEIRISKKKPVPVLIK